MATSLGREREEGRTPGTGPIRVIRTWGTTTGDLLTLADWLLAVSCTPVAESTGVSWTPIWNLLEDTFTLLLINRRNSKAVPGRKTDITDEEATPDLLLHDLLRSSGFSARPHMSQPSASRLAQPTQPSHTHLEAAL